MSIHARNIKNTVQSYMPYMQKRFINKAVSITVRILADELNRSPYEFVTWLGRYQGTINIFEDERRTHDTTTEDDGTVAGDEEG